MKYQYYCRECGYKRPGLLDHPAIGIGSYSTTCPECNGQYDSIEMTLNDIIIERLSQLYQDLPLEHAVYVLDAIYDIEEQMALFSVAVEHGGRSNHK